MKCEYCNNEVPAGVQNCPSCGATVKYQAPASAPAPTPVMSAPVGQCAPDAVPPPPGYIRKNRSTYILLGIFLGGCGIHNFYAGRIRRAVWQLLASVFLGAASGGVVTFGVWVWAIVDVCTIKTDGHGVAFV